MRFPIAEQFGTVITYETSNILTRRPNGGACNIVYHRSPLATYDLSAINFRNSVAEILINFQRLLRGQARIFRYRDPIDHQCDLLENNAPYNTGLGITEIGVLWPNADGARITFQLYKRYRLSVDNTVQDRYRPITRPIAETIQVYENNATKTVTINENTGLVTFSTPPANNATLIWSGEFDVPVRFENSENIALESVVYDEESNTSIYNLPNLRLKEVKEPPGVEINEPLDFQDPNDSVANNFLNHVLSIDLSYGAISQPVFQSINTDLDSGYRYREEQGDRSTVKINVNPQIFLYSNQSRYLVGLYRVCYGTAIAFRINDYDGLSKIPDFGSEQMVDQMFVRFASPLAIEVLQDSINSEESLYRPNSLVLEQCVSSVPLEMAPVSPVFGFNAQGSVYSDQIVLSSDTRYWCHGWRIYFPEEQVPPPSASGGLVIREVIPNSALSIDGFGSTSNSGNIQANIPANSTIQRAYLYSTSIWDLSPVNGVTFNGINLSLSSASVLAPDNNLATTVVWDVTSIVASSLTEGLQNFSIVENGDNDGSVLVIAYRNPSTENVTSIILDGELSTAGSVVQLNFSSPYTGGDVLISIASSFSRQPSGQTTDIDVTTNSTNNRRLTSSAGGQDDGQGADGALITVGGIGDSPTNPGPFDDPFDGPLIDDEYYNLALGNSASPTPFLVPGDTFVRLNTVNVSDDDNVFGMFISGRFRLPENISPLGFTDHDRQFILDNLRYSPLTGFMSEAISQDSSTQEIRSELTSVINSDFITEEDLLTDKYQDASIEMFIYDWSLGTKIRTLFTGSFGDISIEHGINGASRFIMQARSDRYNFSKKMSKVTTQTCRLKFGEQGLGKCNFNLNNVTNNYQVLTVDINDSSFTANSNRPSGFFNKGIVRFTSGRLKNLAREVLSFDGTKFTFATPFPVLPQIGDDFTAIAGCDRTMTACKAYNNFINFGGQPFIPGNDQLMINGQVATEE